MSGIRCPLLPNGQRPTGNGHRAGQLALLVATLLFPVSSNAQVRQPEDTISAGEDAGPISDVSRPLRDDSNSVHDGAGTIGDASSGPVRSGPVRDATSRSMKSGPVSEVSSGPMSEPRPGISSGAVTEASSGAVKHDVANPLGWRISEPLSELAPLQRQMREQRERLEDAARTANTEQPAPAVDEAALGNAAASPPEPPPAEEQIPTDAEVEPPSEADAAEHSNADVPPAVEDAPEETQ